LLTKLLIDLWITATDLLWYCSSKFYFKKRVLYTHSISNHIMFICNHTKSYILIIDNSFLVAWSRLSHIYIWSNPMILLIYTFLVEWTRHSTICISRDCFMRLIITLARTSTTTTGSVQLELINKHVRYSLFPFLLFFCLC
jgi:hypothetical protein